MNTTSHEGLLDRMFNAGAHFGYSRSRRHPSTAGFIFGVKNKTQIIDLEKTQQLLDEAQVFAERLGREGGQLLLVGGKSEARKAIQDAADRAGLPYVAGRWIGGTLTNFSEIKKRINRLLELQEQKESGELAEKYTKREQLLLDREIERLRERFGGIVSMKDSLPKALFVIDTGYEAIAVEEARVLGVPVIGLLNIDCDASRVEYPIVANDATQASITFFVNEIIDAYQKGKSEYKIPPETA